MEFLELSIMEVHQQIWMLIIRLLHQFGIQVLLFLDLENIRVKLRLYGGTYDKLADPTDLNAFWNNLSPVAQ